MSGETTSFLRQGRYRQRRILLSNVKSSGMLLDQDVGDARDLVVQPRTLREQRPCWYRATQAKEPAHVSRLRTAPPAQAGSLRPRPSFAKHRLAASPSADHVTTATVVSRQEPVVKFTLQNQAIAARRAGRWCNLRQSARDYPCCRAWHRVRTPIGPTLRRAASQRQDRRFDRRPGPGFHSQ